jgi:four helix bundle protein
MATFQTFVEIEAWQKARILTSEIYAVSNRASFSKDFGLRDQIRRATVSIMSNIAEGFERSGSGEFVHFLAVAKGSAGEVVSHLYVAADQGYLSQGEFQRLSKLAIDTGRVIGGLMIYLRKSNLKGPKYKSSIR